MGESIYRTIYCTRDSFHMGDDCVAPHLYKFSWHDCDWCPEVDIFRIIEDYLGPNLPGFYWRGYSGGKIIVDVNLHREKCSFSREIKMGDGWRELLRENLSIHFLHQKYDDRDELPETIEPNMYYTPEKAEKLIRDYGLSVVTDKTIPKIIPEKYDLGKGENQESTFKYNGGIFI